MRFFGTNGFAAFQPPSDMAGDGSGTGGGGKKKLLVGLGIGCGVILLLIGILFAAGAFKAVSCCSDVKNIAESSTAASAFGQTFADAVAEGKLDEAYAMTSPQFQATTSRQAFGDVIETHREQMKSSPPRLFDTQIKMDGEPDSMESIKQGSWSLTFQFAEPTDDTMVLLTLVAKRTGEGEAATFVADDVQIDERPRNLAAEPPAEEVLKIHDLLQRGSYEMAYSRLAPAFQEQSDFEGFRKFLEDAGDILQRSELAIREVGYNDQNTQATVMAQATTTSGQTAIVQYELVPLQPEMPGFGWRVVTIAPILAAQNDAAATPEPAVTNGATNSATNGAPDVKLPAVEVTP